MTDAANYPCPCRGHLVFEEGPGSYEIGPICFWDEDPRLAQSSQIEQNMTMVPNQDLLTPEQAAEYLQVHRETIYRYIRGGQLIASRLGRTYRIPKQSLDLLLW